MGSKREGTLKKKFIKEYFGEGAESLPKYKRMFSSPGTFPSGVIVPAGESRHTLGSEIRSVGTSEMRIDEDSKVPVLLTDRNISSRVHLHSGVYKYAGGH